MNDKKYLLAGDSSILMLIGNEINEEINKRACALNKAVKNLNHNGIIEAVPTYCSLMVHYRPEILKYTEVINILNKLDENLKLNDSVENEVIEIPVLYGGDTGVDLSLVAKHNNLSEDEVIEIHSKPEYLIYMLGFTPGFPYLGGMDTKISTPRLEKPRVKIEAGSVGIAGEQTGIYPIDSPGGWQIIGQTPLKLYDAKRQEPILLKAGQYIKFKSINKDQFDLIKSKNSDLSPSDNTTNTSKGIIVKNGGFLTTVQDLGRYEFQEFGVPVSGAMDKRSYKLANILVDNNENEAVLEVTMMGPTLEFEEDNIIAITGGNLSPQINNMDVDMYTAILCKKGDVLSFKGVKNGCRAYIGFSGGLSIPLVMGSRSTYIKAKIGGYEGRKLEKDDKIGFTSPKGYIKSLHKRKLNGYEANSDTINLRVIMGPQDDYFTEAGINTFLSSTYTVTNEFDRMGCRLDGAIIEHKKDGNIISDGIAFGAIQIPSHGKPIIMLADRQTIGGYTKIANVINVDLPKLAQSKPGDKITFSKISIENAQELYINEIEKLKKIKEEFNKESSNKINYYKLKLNDKIYNVSVEEV